jgi:RibD C-terminal domain
MGAIRVHEFISLDSVIDTPSWTFQFGFDPRMGEAIGRITMSSDGILLGRMTYEMFEPTWSKRTVEEDPGRALLQRHPQVRRVVHARHGDVAELGDHRGVRP